MSDEAYRLLAEETGKRFYLRDGTVTEVRMETRGQCAVISPYTDWASIAAAIAVELTVEWQALGWEVAKLPFETVLSKPMSLYDDAGVVTSPRMRLLEVHIGVWPAPGA